MAHQTRHSNAGCAAHTIAMTTASPTPIQTRTQPDLASPLHQDPSGHYQGLQTCEPNFPQFSQTHFHKLTNCREI